MHNKQSFKGIEDEKNGDFHEILEEKEPSVEELLKAETELKEIEEQMQETSALPKPTSQKTSNLKIYLRQIGKYRPLSYENEFRLGRQIKEGSNPEYSQKAKEYLIQANLKLVPLIAQKYRNKGLSVDELIQEGNVGLIKAAEKYDYKKGYRFDTYAVYWIRQGMIQALYDKSRTIRVPLNRLKNNQTLIDTRKKILEKENRHPSDEELSEKLNIPIEKIKDLNTTPVSITSLDQPVNRKGSEPVPLGDTLDFNDYYQYEGDIPSENKEKLDPELIKIVDKFLDRKELKSGKMKDKHRKVFNLVFKEGKSYREAGAEVGISHEQVRQIVNKYTSWLSQSSEMKDYYFD